MEDLDMESHDMESLLFMCPVSPLMLCQSWQWDEPVTTNKDVSTVRYPDKTKFK